jgi:predicted nucleic acid-binding protein
VKDAVFLDTGIFVAFLNRRDQWHAQVVALSSGTKPNWCTSDHHLSLTGTETLPRS